MAADNTSARRVPRSQAGGDDVLSRVLRVAAAVPIGLTLLPLWRTGRGWVRIWDFPRVQVAATGGLVLSGLLTRRSRVDRILSGMVAGSVLYQASKILPYTPFFPKQVRRAEGRDLERRLRIFMANVLQDNRSSDRVLQAIREADADVVCLAETDGWWEEQLRPIEREYPWAMKCPLSNTYGMLLFSRLPWRNPETRFLVMPDVPSMRVTLQLRSGDEVNVFAVHPQPPLPGSPSYGRDAELVMVGREIEASGKPSVVVGDLNDVAWSYTTKLFQRVSHTLDPRVGRGRFSTFHADYWLARWPLDHVFHTRHFTVAELRRIEHVGSDHFPILVELVFQPERLDQAPEPQTTQSDEQEAQEILEDAPKARETPPVIG